LKPLHTDFCKCCNPGSNGDGGWGVFNSLFGWQNSATYGSVISYNLYWLTIIVGFLVLGYKERAGHWPLRKPSKGAEQVPSERSDSHDREITNKEEGVAASSAVREVQA
jgi:high-affinity iron transporter